MKHAVKFTFDTHFDEPSSHSAIDAPARRNPTVADIERARSEGYAAGFAAGDAEATARADRDVQMAMNELASGAATLIAAMEAKSRALTADAVQMAVTCARKLAPASIAARPETEIEAVVRDCLSHLNREPHILLRVSASLVDRLKDKVDHMAMERGLTGRIILLGEPDMSGGNCVVEWADGGVVRSYEDIESEIMKIVARYIETLDAQDANGLSMPEFGMADSDRS
ncbi:MAG: FliH/SctL family protein [Parvibaculum sp.]|uniref:FliH/SctL family protein n=1 Tax=Parvibaculum sp. TaxID=2024848 RepID=UPI00271D25A0|nr:FliH/SctL family protein [Parvibaculum sp.]MDO8839310.1 FliH/SctL family protein [Parvibaculum sp.]